MSTDVRRIKLKKEGWAYLNINPVVCVVVTQRADGDGWQWPCACGTTDEGPYTRDLFAEMGAHLHCQWHTEGEHPDFGTLSLQG